MEFDDSKIVRSSSDVEWILTFRLIGFVQSKMGSNKQQSRGQIEAA